MSTTLGVRVARKTTEAEGICSFELVAADGRPLPAFSAGAHIDVHVPGGLVRQYSLCNDPGETHRYQIAVLDDAASRGGSRALHAQVHEGDTLAIGAPRNQFRLVPQARRHLLLAGGIGVTPLLAMAESLATEGADFELHYATRSVARTAFIGRIQRSRYAARAHLHVDDGDPAQRLDLPTVLAAPTAGTHAYVCGPQGFIDAVLAQARMQGWPEAQLHVEFFGAAPAATEGNGAFEVELARSGRVITVPASRSVAEALLDAGVEIALSCEQGICGTCLTRVLSGLPDHRDSYLTPQEQAANDQFTPCCSRSRSARLVLDL